MKINESINKYPLAIGVFMGLFVVVVVSVGAYCSVKYFQYVKEKMREQSIINACEDMKWQNDCYPYLYLKPKVKKSNSGICHGEDSTYYYRTKSYRIFDSIEDCLKNGGRLPNN